MGCINFFLRKGFIPIIDLQSYPNVFNRFNVNESNKNPWEYFFYQPFGYRLNSIKKTSKIHYFECKSDNIRPNENIFYNNQIKNFWHKMSKIYLPIKKKSDFVSKNNY